MTFDQFNRPALMFRAFDCALFKGDSSRNQTQSTSTTTQVDNRVAATDGGIAIGTGGALDQSVTDNSRTEINATDSSTHSLDQSVNDNSQTTLNTTDSRDQSTTVNDSRAWTDNSVHYTLDGELANAALRTGAESLHDAGAVMEATLRGSVDLAGRALDANGAAVRAAIDSGAASAESSAKSQTAFLSSFYRDRENNDTKVTGDLIKYAGAAAIVGLLAWAAK